MAGQKTNVMRILDQKKIRYAAHFYSSESHAFEGGIAAAKALGQNPAQVFKTLVTVGGSGKYFVFVIPVEAELDLKKAAAAAGVKSVAMLHLSELRSVTGYVRGGCSPVGMKKSFPTVFHSSAIQFETIMVSAGKVGSQVEADPRALAGLVGGTFADITCGEPL